MEHVRSDQETVLLGVHRAWRAVRFAHGAEALLVGLGAALTTLAAAGFQGIHPTERDILIVATVTGAAVGLTWALSNRITLERVADRVDRRMRCEGALVASWEHAARTEPMARLLAKHVLHRTPSRRWVQFAIPNSMPWVVAPLLGGILLAQSIPHPHDARIGRGDPIELLRGFQGHLDRAKEAGLESGASMDGTQDLDAETLRDLMHSSQSGRRVVPDQSAMESWLEEASGLLPRLPPGSQAREEFEQAMALGEAAALALDRTGRDVDVPDVLDGDPLKSPADREGESRIASDGDLGAEGPPGPSHEVAPGSDSGSSDSEPGVPGQDLGTGSDPEVAGGGRDGTMSGLIPPNGVPNPDPTVSSAGSERGLTERRWWSDRDASLVRRWVELQRQDPAPASDAPPRD